MSAPGKSYMRAMRDTSLLFGMNDVYLEGLYEDYLADPASVPDAWRAWFDALQATPGAMHEVAHRPVRRAFAALPGQPAVICTPGHKQAPVLQLINAHRYLGVRIANLDPLARNAGPEVPELDPAFYGFTEAEMDTVFEADALAAGARLTL